MTPQLIAIMAQIAACEARVHGMHSHNLAQAVAGTDRFYNESAFLEEASALEHLAEAARNA